MTQSKKQNKSLETGSKETEAYELPDKELELTAQKMLKKLKKSMHETRKFSKMK